MGAAPRRTVWAAFFAGAAPGISCIFHGAAPGISCIFHWRGTRHFLHNRNFPDFARSSSVHISIPRFLQEKFIPPPDFLLANHGISHFCKKPFEQDAPNLLGTPNATPRTTAPRRTAWATFFAGAAPGISCITEIFLILQEALRCIFLFRAFCKNDLFLCQVFFLQILEIRTFARSLSSKTR